MAAANEPLAVPPQGKELEASVLDLDPKPEGTSSPISCHTDETRTHPSPVSLRYLHLVITPNYAHADTRGRHATVQPSLRTLRPLRRSSSRIQRWVQDQQKRLSGDETIGDDSEEDDLATPATAAPLAASGCNPWMAYPDMRKPSHVPSENDEYKRNASEREIPKDAYEAEGMDYVVIDTELSNALRNASVTQVSCDTVTRVTFSCPRARSRFSFAQVALRFFTLSPNYFTNHTLLCV